ncbi:hypothetical protein [Parachlamydia acanthamoebae]|uniref:Uncharacterized protein n=1 Tax=Parachlamydia acanthamoebae TaxID=83552 RepID=A0A0C1C507_9BACT|nr:hypothetical protein [Parachlamydia acanthamoebae]KIA78516.1 hypothetical protein DB43_DW00120 [Parachlamydia acanthamoebae]
MQITGTNPLNQDEWLCTSPEIGLGPNGCTTRHNHCHISLLFDAAQRPLVSENHLFQELEKIQKCLEFFSSQIRSDLIIFPPQIKKKMLLSFISDIKLFETTFNCVSLKKNDADLMSDYITRLFTETLSGYSESSHASPISSTESSPTPRLAVQHRFGPKNKQPSFNNESKTCEHTHGLYLKSTYLSKRTIPQLKDLMEKISHCCDFHFKALAEYPEEQEKLLEKENSLIKHIRMQLEAKEKALMQSSAVEKESDSTESDSFSCDLNDTSEKPQSEFTTYSRKRHSPEESEDSSTFPQSPLPRNKRIRPTEFHNQLQQRLSVAARAGEPHSQSKTPSHSSPLFSMHFESPSARSSSTIGSPLPSKNSPHPIFPSTTPLKFPLFSPQSYLSEAARRATEIPSKKATSSRYSLFRVPSSPSHSPLSTHRKISPHPISPSTDRFGSPLSAPSPRFSFPPLSSSAAGGITLLPLFRERAESPLPRDMGDSAFEAHNQESSPYPTFIPEDHFDSPFIPHPSPISRRKNVSADDRRSEPPRTTSTKTKIRFTHIRKEQLESEKAERSEKETSEKLGINFVLNHQ